jgi:hypothetical protein
MISATEKNIYIDKAILARTTSFSFFDASVRQSLARVVLPGLTIYSIVRLPDIMTKTALLEAKANSTFFSK